MSQGSFFAPLRCPACLSEQVRIGPQSRTTGSMVATCLRCDTHWLGNSASAEEIAQSYDFDHEAYGAYVDAQRHDTLDLAHEEALRRIGEMIQSGGKALFDIGAGVGDFLSLARDRGFEPHGNELAPGAITLAKERAGIDLHFGDLSGIEGENLYDAVTMWCVLAHVGQPDELLTHILRVLKPGGVLFLQTPRWSAMDTMALGMSRFSGGRQARVLDRRVNNAHIVLHSKQGLTAQVERAGFDIVDVQALARYSMKTESYLSSLGVPEGLGRIATKGLDQAVDRNIFFRNIFDLYARKPLA